MYILIYGHHDVAASGVGGSPGWPSRAAGKAHAEYPPDGRWTRRSRRGRHKKGRHAAATAQRSPRSTVRHVDMGK